MYNWQQCTPSNLHVCLVWCNRCTVTVSTLELLQRTYNDALCNGYTCREQQKQLQCNRCIRKASINSCIEQRMTQWIQVNEVQRYDELICPSMLAPLIGHNCWIIAEYHKLIVAYLWQARKNRIGEATWIYNKFEQKTHWLKQDKGMYTCVYMQYSLMVKLWLTLKLEWLHMPR